MQRIVTLTAASLFCGGLVFASLASAPRDAADPTATPSAMVATYDSLADAILSVKNTEARLVRSILEATWAHAQQSRAAAERAIAAGDDAAARASLEQLAALVAQMGTEGDNAVAGVRKRLVEGGHHHNADGEKQGIYDTGYVIVTRVAKKSLLDASRAIGQLSRQPDAAALAGEWAKAEAAWKSLAASR